METELHCPRYGMIIRSLFTITFLLFPDPCKSDRTTQQPRPRKPITHISEFTDPDTGLNPFLDLEEGLSAINRNIMEDQQRNDPPIPDFDIEEGEGSQDRGRIFVPEPIWPNYPKATEKVPIWQWPFEDIETPVTTERTSLFSEEATTEIIIEDTKQETSETETYAVSNETLICASVATASVVTIILIVAACWWRRKLKRTAVSEGSSSCKC